MAEMTEAERALTLGKAFLEGFKAGITDGEKDRNKLRRLRQDVGKRYEQAIKWEKLMKELRDDDLQPGVEKSKTIAEVNK